MWKSCVLSTSFYNKLSGHYKVTIDGKQRRFNLVTSGLHLARFYVSFIPLFLTFLGSTLRIRDTFLIGENSAQILVVSFGEAFVALACIALNIIVILFGAELVDVMNHSFALLMDTTKLSNIPPNNKCVFFIFIRGKIESSTVRNISLRS